MQSYYDVADFAKFNGDGVGSYASDKWQNFLTYYGSVFQDGALSAREKALMALSVAVALQCPYCIDAFSNSCLQKGCDGDQILEAFHVAAAIRSGAALAHGVQVLDAIEDSEL